MKKTNLIIINRVYLTLNNQYEKFLIDLSPQLIIYDECQGITARTSFNFLNFAKTRWNSSIIGFSATPLRVTKTRKIQKQTNLNEIFDKESKLQIYQNYNILKAIDDGICCKLNFVWYKLEGRKNEEKKSRFKEVTEEDVKNCMYILNDNIDKLYYKKIICWCSSIKNANLYKDLFIKIKNEDESLSKLRNLDAYIDNSDRDCNPEDYKNFYESIGNSILFCVGKHREGSDIPFLDCGMFLDRVKYRSDVVWLQSIGRIARLSLNKDFGLIIDTYYERENTNEYEIIIEKLIGYYLLLDSLTIDDNKNKKSMYEQAKKDIYIDNDERKIHLSKFDVICEGLNWDEFSSNFNHIFDHQIQREIKLSNKDRLHIICQSLKNDYGWDENTDFWNEYKLIDKSINKFPESIYSEFESEFSKKTWYELLGFKHLFFKNVEEVQNFFKKNNVYYINEEIYNEWCLREPRLPKYHEQYFHLDRKYTNINSLVKNLKIYF